MRLRAWIEAAALRTGVHAPRRRATARRDDRARAHTQPLNGPCMCNVCVCARARVRRGQWPTVTCHDEVKSLSWLSFRNKCAFCQCFHSSQWFSLCWRDAKFIWNLAALSRGCWGVMAEHGNFTFCSHFCSSGQSPWRDRGTRVETALKTSTLPANDHLPADVPPTHTHAEFYLLPCSCRIKPVIPHTPGCWQIGSRLADSVNMINICFLKMMCSHPARVTEIEHSLWVFRWTEWFYLLSSSIHQPNHWCYQFGD